VANGSPRRDSQKFIDCRLALTTLKTFVSFPKSFSDNASHIIPCCTGYGSGQAVCFRIFDVESHIWISSVIIPDFLPFYVALEMELRSVRVSACSGAEVKFPAQWIAPRLGRMLKADSPEARKHTAPGL
jgi:hypothetical protein